MAATASSHSHISALLDLHERASTRNSRLVQVCVIDHTSPLVAEGLPHLHIQFLFSGHTRTAWAYVDTDLATLNEAILSWSARSRHRISLRVHLHEEMPSNGGPADAEAVAALPRLVLQQASAVRRGRRGRVHAVQRQPHLAHPVPCQVAGDSFYMPIVPLHAAIQRLGARHHGAV